MMLFCDPIQNVVSPLTFEAAMPLRPTSITFSKIYDVFNPIVYGGLMCKKSISFSGFSMLKSL